MNNWAEDVNVFLKEHFKNCGGEIQRYSPQLLEAMEYSLHSGGKRFRPQILLQTAELLNVDFANAIPYAAAVELIHTYSLVHDDLPCMDNDLVRRGHPTTHVQFGEAQALLTGDALLTEAFSLIASFYIQEKSMIGIQLIAALARASGASGMVGAQSMDMALGVPIDSLESLLLCHKGKTAALISAAIEGAGIIGELAPQEAGYLRSFGEKLGLSFQIKDDLLDCENSPKSILYYVDVSYAEKYLNTLSEDASRVLQNLPVRYRKLMDFFNYNFERSQ